VRSLTWTGEGNWCNSWKRERIFFSFDQDFPSGAPPFSAAHLPAGAGDWSPPGGSHTTWDRHSWICYGDLPAGNAAIPGSFYRHPLAPENVLHHSAKVDDPFLSAVGAFQRPFSLLCRYWFPGAWSRDDHTPGDSGSVFTACVHSARRCSPPLLFSEVPPLELSEKGYDEVIESLLVAFLIPAISLSMQTGELHLLLVLFCVPLAFLYLAMRIVRGLENYGKDSLTGRQTMLVRMGWQRGMNLHHLSLIGAYLMVGVSAVLLLPWSLTWPMLLSLPIAVLQILQVQQIAAGAKPNWRLVDLTAIASFGITAYMITLTLWIR